jgi:hypothetical protein
MLRLLLLLFVGLFATWQIAGADRGQKRLGLMVAETAPEPVVTAAPVAEPEPEPQAVPVVLTPPTPVMTPPVMTTPVVTASVETAPADLFYVTGRSVNVRSGPSTGGAVIGTLTRGEAVSVIWVEDNGWARVRVEGDGIDGFMSMDFLTDAPR